MGERKEVKHGLSGTRIKRIYYNMHSRCENSNTPKFKNHGGRGIKVCEEWSGGGKGLVNFYNWAMANGYREDLTLDREDNDGDYTPENCRWVDYEEQNRNHRRNHYITIDGVTKLLVDWCNEYNVDDSTMWKRLKDGVTDKDLLAPPKIYPGSGSGFVGVYYRPDNNKWKARISKDGVEHSLGNYKKLSDAVYARLDGELEYYGHYINDIDEVSERLKEVLLKEKEAC